MSINDCIFGILKFRVGNNNNQVAWKQHPVYLILKMDAITSEAEPYSWRFHTQIAALANTPSANEPISPHVNTNKQDQYILNQ